jgi:hypothetical protein
MIVFALLISKFTNCDTNTKINQYEWLLLVSGSTVLIIGFISDYVKFMLQYFSLGEIFSPSNTVRLMEKALTYVPASFPWLIFTFGIAIIIGGIVLFYIRNKRIFWLK